MAIAFSAVLLAGGKSSRMGRDKAFIEFEGVPLWRRQLGVLRQLHPTEIFIAGPLRPEWSGACDAVLPDTNGDSGPLAGLLSGFHHGTTPFLLALAIDMPQMTAEFLIELTASCGLGEGVVPVMNERYEPLAAVYPRAAATIAEAQMRAGHLSLQDFVRACLVAGFLREKRLAPSTHSLFLNLNTPNDLSSMR
ncbi:MAG: molybdenum cofactor guanylyltransferase [Chthoniobacterales bacterium]